jgi:hypothetical protein
MDSSVAFYAGKWRNSTVFLSFSMNLSLLSEFMQVATGSYVVSHGRHTIPEYGRTALRVYT